MLQNILWNLFNWHKHNYTFKISIYIVRFRIWYVLFQMNNIKWMVGRSRELEVLFKLFDNKVIYPTFNLIYAYMCADIKFQLFNDNMRHIICCFLLCVSSLYEIRKQLVTSIIISRRRYFICTIALVSAFNWI